MLLLFQVDTWLANVLMLAMSLFSCLAAGRFVKSGDKQPLKWLIPLAVGFFVNALNMVVLRLFGFFHVHRTFWNYSCIFAMDMIADFSFAYGTMILWLMSRKRANLDTGDLQHREEVWPPAPKSS